MNQTLVLIVDRREDAITPLLNQVRFMINIIMKKIFLLVDISSNGS